ncbi:MAG: hypothetical protein Q8868_11930 [Bacteroidota bacterium]|nr:hypothetical protein [Bacteroidota bacterium]
MFFLFLVICFSCEENGWFVNCSDCVEEEPQKAQLHVKINESDNQVYIVVYDGEIEDSIIYDFAYSRGPDFNFDVSLNKLYTVTAKYNFIKGGTYTAVDSATPRVKYTKDECNDPCYFVYDREVNLRLKYYAK